MQANDLAILMRTGLATAAEKEDLAAQTTAIARAAARQYKALPPDDRDDIAQIATVRALRRVKKWRREMGSWTTFVHMAVRAVASTWRRRLAREAEALAGYAAYIEGGEDDEQD